MQIWQKADVGNPVKITGDLGEIPAGSVGVVTGINELNQNYFVRICGIDTCLTDVMFEVVNVDGSGTSASAANGSEEKPGESAANSAGDVSRVCEKCGRVFDETGSASS